jgi:hypothetical protein
MIYTEKEAAEKWCPHTRFISLVSTTRITQLGPPGNRYGDGYENVVNPGFSRCIGSRCMMWQWAEPPTRQDRKEDRRGGCGLAGVADWRG